MFLRNVVCAVIFCNSVRLVVYQHPFAIFRKAAIYNALQQHRLVRVRAQQLPRPYAQIELHLPPHGFRAQQPLPKLSVKERRNAPRRHCIGNGFVHKSGFDQALRKLRDASLRDGLIKRQPPHYFMHGRAELRRGNIFLPRKAWRIGQLHLLPAAQ